MREIQTFFINQLVYKLSHINEFPDGFFPQSVYIEEESDKYPVYNRYELLEIYADGSCRLRNTTDCGEEKRDLNEINMDWLSTVWHHYKDCLAMESSKELAAFIYPASRFDRNADDKEIIKDYQIPDQQCPEVEKLTPDELSARLNDEGSIGEGFYIRFIKY